ncbi:hypothetical protein K0M31_009103 [Melipona bicolor]|uniref:Uncharacterized protein n=1 Tax=Melipona bicolor TaxID=60889 RepID=A0AA40FPK2_9HYME|nr:hypothetical protein K0M31_009103 [Melipona bicolor]
MPGLEGSISRDASLSTVSLMSDRIVSEEVKKFLFTSRKTQDNIQCNESLEIYIPELLQANYSFYTWPSAPVLAWFLWEHKEELIGKRVLELGSDTRYLAFNTDTYKENLPWTDIEEDTEEDDVEANCNINKDSVINHFLKHSKK